MTQQHTIFTASLVLAMRWIVLANEYSMLFIKYLLQIKLTKTQYNH